MQNNHFLTALPVEPHTVCGTPPPESVQIEFSTLPSFRNIELTSRLQDTYILPLLFIFIKQYLQASICLLLCLDNSFVCSFSGALMK